MTTDAKVLPTGDLSDDELKSLQFLSVYGSANRIISTTTLNRMIGEIRRRRKMEAK